VLALWRQAVDPRGTIVETYLNSRALDLGDDLAGEVLRWHPRIGAMLALFRDIVTDEPRAVSRTFLDREGRKLSRKFFGPVGGAAIKLDPDDAVTQGLHIGEGIETCMAARQLELRPTWALGSTGAIGAFPVLSGIECLTLLAERDEASSRAVEACAARWFQAYCPRLSRRLPRLGRQ
jgi:putative DNA primase/helicase